MVSPLSLPIGLPFLSQVSGLSPSKPCGCCFCFCCCCCCGGCGAPPAAVGASGGPPAAGRARGPDSKKCLLKACSSNICAALMVQPHPTSLVMAIQLLSKTIGMLLLLLLLEELLLLLVLVLLHQGSAAAASVASSCDAAGLFLSLQQR